jgi:hypothetical protein
MIIAPKDPLVKTFFKLAQNIFQNDLSPCNHWPFNLSAFNSGEGKLEKKFYTDLP